MKAIRRWPWCLGPATLGLALTTLCGCQTWIAGMTLPSGRYLQHPPQYFPPSPAFPLQRELATQEAIAAQAGLLGTQPGGLPPSPIVPPVNPGVAPPVIPPGGGAVPGERVPAPQPGVGGAPMAPMGAPMNPGM